MRRDAKSGVAEVKVVIVQRRLTHYRVPLFSGLRTALAADGIKLDLLVGSGTQEELQKRDAGDLPWAGRLPTRYLAGGRLCWQPFAARLGDADLVIVTQENKLLNNHLALLGPRRHRVAFWGHGGNFQSRGSAGWKEGFKRWTTRRADWWFAYTQLSADRIAAAGFPRERITVLNNASDTSELHRWRQEITADDLRRRRESLGLAGGPVGVFVGSLYADKRLDFLLTAAKAVRQRIPGFGLLMVGDGPERDKVRGWVEEYSWVRWVGALHGREKVLHLAAADVMLNPGLVGLGILDSFALGVPLITTAWPYHSPEIAYVNPGINAIVAPDDTLSYAEATVALLQSESRLAQLRAECRACAKTYTLESMIARFAEGIRCALVRGAAS